VRRQFVALFISSIAVSGAVAPFAQSKPAPAFEVASVRLATGGPSRRSSVITDRRVDITESLRGILSLAFRVMSPAQLVTPWPPPFDEAVDIHATLPAGATVQQVPEMLQQLLAERFGLVVHRESRPMDAYELVVGANGTTMREVEPVDELRKEFPPDPALKTPSAWTERRRRHWARCARLFIRRSTRS